jgi:glycosyltransferase involved in cell wall biosynthesis
MTSVVVPVYNAADVLSASLEAVLAQEGVDEWVWVDDGSTDGSAALIEARIASVPAARLVCHAANRGRAAARNTGVAACRGDVVVWFDADVSPHPGAVRAMVSALDASGVVAAVASLRPVGLDPSDPYHLYLRRFRRGPHAHAAGDRIAWRFFLTGACALRREALDGVGGLRESIRYGEDADLAVRLAVRRPDGLVLAGATVDLDGIGSLETALGHIESFAAALPVIALQTSSTYKQLHLERLDQPSPLTRLAASPILAQMVRSLLPLLPRAGVPWAVRYLLGQRLLAAHAHARAAQQR